jgi:hypothetical protein
MDILNGSMHVHVVIIIMYLIIVVVFNIAFITYESSSASSSSSSSSSSSLLMLQAAKVSDYLTQGVGHRAILSSLCRSRGMQATRSCLLRKHWLKSPNKQAQYLN